MTRLLLVTAPGGPALEYAVPKLVAHADLQVLPLTPLSALDRTTLEQWGCAIFDDRTGRDGAGAIVEAARSVHADGVVTFSEYAVVAVADACLALGLPGPGPSARNARDKARMRELWRNAGVPVPAFVPVRELGDLYAAGERLPSPFLLKSAWGAGSIGQRIVREEDDLRQVWDDTRVTLAAAAAAGRADHACPDNLDKMLAEAIIESTTSSWYEAEDSPPSEWGDYVSVEGIVANGTYHPVCVTGRLPTIEPFTELANLAPCALPKDAQRLLEAHARRAVDLLGLHTCGTHTEIKLCANRTVCLLETAARLPGAMVTREVEEVWGVDLVGILAQLALGVDAAAVGLPTEMLVSGARGAAATVALLATDTRGRPWQTLPRFDPQSVDWHALTGPSTAVEVVQASTVAPGSPMPAYDVAAGTMNFAGLAFVTAPDPASLLRDARRIIDGLEGAVTGGTEAGRLAYGCEQPGVDEVVQLFRRAGLNGPLDEPERVQQMLRQATFHGTARTGRRLVGYIRVLTDFSYNAFVADLAVDPSVQGRGIGRTLLAQATVPYPGIKFVVMPGTDSADFYARSGFEPAPTCMVRPRTR